MNLEKAFLPIALIVSSIVISATTYVLISHQLQNQAVTSCLQASGIYEYTKENIKTTAPQKEFYNICMTDKGYKSSWK